MWKVEMSLDLYIEITIIKRIIETRTTLRCPFYECLYQMLVTSEFVYILPFFSCCCCCYLSQVKYVLCEREEKKIT